MKKFIRRLLYTKSKSALDTYGFNAKGEVSVYIFKGVEWKLLHTKSNAIQPIANEVVAERLAENNLVRIDQIELLNVSLSLATRNISERIVTNGNEVTFNAIFDEASFSGPFTEGRLISSAKGNFSIITGLALNKAPTEKIMISWKLTIQ